MPNGTFDEIEYISFKARCLESVMIEKTISITPVFTGRMISVETQQVELEPGHRAYREIIRRHGQEG